MGKTFTLTDEQTAIVDAVATKEPLTVEAGAGTGKTSTLIAIAKANPDRTFLYLAFNRAIKEEAATKFPANVSCYTTHGLALRSNPGFWQKMQLSKGIQKTSDLVRLMRVNSGYQSKSADLDRYNIAAYARDMVSRFCQSADPELGWWHLDRNHIPLCDTEERKHIASILMPYAKHMWLDLQEEYPIFKFTHDHYRKIWAMNGPHLGVDAILFDEAQDAQPVITGVVQRQRNSQTIVVGDSNQEIYTFAGARSAMQKFNGQRLFLTQSFRFGDAIAETANLILERLDSDMRLKGLGSVASTVGLDVEKPDAILCRTNAEAISQVMKNMNRKVALAGGGDDLLALAKAAKMLKSGRKPQHPDLASFRTWDDVQSYVEYDPAGRDLKTLVNLVDDHGPDTLITVLQRLIPQRKGRLGKQDAVQEAMAKAEVVISTAHKGKGLEWPVVQIAKDFASPLDTDTDGNPKEVGSAEMRLAYVAVTRAIDGLGLGSLDWITNPAANPRKNGVDSG